MSVWIKIEHADNTHAMEIPGVGVIVRVISWGGPSAAISSVFVPGARVKDGNVQREDRNAPPLVDGKKLSDITVRPDPGAKQYLIDDEE